MQAIRSNTAVSALASPLAVGPHLIRDRVFLAPMSGITDRPFRDLVAGFGCSYVISEMVASEELVTGNREAQMRAERGASALHVVQLAGREAHWMAEGARAAEDAGADILDINMGCPAKKVTGGYSGSALMRDLDHALTLIEATVGAATVPVTLKMRLGWDHSTINAPELARRAEAAGVQMITVHGRTRCQFYEGAADWAAVRAVKDAVSIPVIANGDLVAADQIEGMLALSGADGVMIGRGAYGRPWLPGAVAEFARNGRTPKQPAAEEILEIALAHYEAMLGRYGSAVGVRHARKHLGWYMDQVATAADQAPLRRTILTESDPSKVQALLRAWFGASQERRAA
jgi:tRNA-dihydrouridine synthase B